MFRLFPFNYTTDLTVADQNIPTRAGSPWDFFQDATMDRSYRSPTFAKLKETEQTLGVGDMRESFVSDNMDEGVQEQKSVNVRVLQNKIKNANMKMSDQRNSNPTKFTKHSMLSADKIPKFMHTKIMKRNSRMKDQVKGAVSGDRSIADTIWGWLTFDGRNSRQNKDTEITVTNDKIKATKPSLAYQLTKEFQNFLSLQSHTNQAINRRQDRKSSHKREHSLLMKNNHQRQKSDILSPLSKGSNKNNPLINESFDSNLDNNDNLKCFIRRSRALLKNEQLIKSQKALSPSSTNSQQYSQRIEDDRYESINFLSPQQSVGSLRGPLKNGRRILNRSELPSLDKVVFDAAAVFNLNTYELKGLRSAETKDMKFENLTAGPKKVVVQQHNSDQNCQIQKIKNHLKNQLAKQQVKNKSSRQLNTKIWNHSYPSVVIDLIPVSESQQHPQVQPFMSKEKQRISYVRSERTSFSISRNDLGVKGGKQRDQSKSSNKKLIDDMKVSIPREVTIQPSERSEFQMQFNFFKPIDASIIERSLGRTEIQSRQRSLSKEIFKQVQIGNLQNLKKHDEKPIQLENKKQGLNTRVSNFCKENMKPQKKIKSQVKNKNVTGQVQTGGNKKKLLNRVL